jgi:acyl-CoA dehydrogenase
VALKVIDRAVHMYAGRDVADDFPLASMYGHQSTLRGSRRPDEGHKRTAPGMS